MPRDAATRSCTSSRGSADSIRFRFLTEDDMTISRRSLLVTTGAAAAGSLLATRRAAAQTGVDGSKSAALFLKEDDGLTHHLLHGPLSFHDGASVHGLPSRRQDGRDLVPSGSRPRPGQELVGHRDRVLLRLPARGGRFSQPGQGPAGREGQPLRMDAEGVEEARLRRKAHRNGPGAQQPAERLGREDLTASSTRRMRSRATCCSRRGPT